ncbi:hypothetical protein [Streptomyces sp. NPDC006012]|uniref:hypothetical protein n=1 Tax=Streptomyces sp. NPDC006012 TaxID=3364739 RepID=UPI0036B9E28B
MTNQPYDGGSYDGYNPYRQPPPQGHQSPQGRQQAPHQAQPQPQHQPQAWPGQPGHGQAGYGPGGYAQPGYEQPGSGQSYPDRPFPDQSLPDQSYPDQPGYEQSGYDRSGFDAHQTQQWQGQTWETQVHEPLPSAAAAEETAYLPTYGHPVGPAPAAPQAHPAPQAQQPTPAAAPIPDAAPDAAAGSRYGPATVSGNARVTDAQRARMEGRSPIIEPGMQPAALTALLGLLIAGAAAIGSYALVVPLVVLQAVTAAGWFRLNGMWPARQGIALAFAGALTADLALLAAGREHAPAAILGPLGVWVLLALVLQLRSHADPDERMYGLMATVVATALSVVATGYLGADPHAVSVGAVAVAVAVLARALPLPTPVSVVVALLAATGAGIAVGGMTGLGAKGALVGLAAAGCALVGHRAASYDYPSRFVHFTAGVALPLSAAAPAVWVLGQALG